MIEAIIIVCVIIVIILLAYKLRRKLKPKGPKDWRLTPNSKKWIVESYCSNCKSRITHEEWMAKICNSCGYILEDTQYFKDRVKREIWNGKKWVTQYKYGNSEKDYEIVGE